MARLLVVVTVVVVMLAVSLRLTAGHNKERKEKTNEGARVTNNARKTFTLENLESALGKARKRYPHDRKGLNKLRALLERRTEQKSVGRKREKADLSALESVFNAFCATPGLMDKDKFAKLTRDLNLLDKRLTDKDVDITFTKAKANKSDRKIDFDRFQDAVSLMAQIKYPADPEGSNKLIALIVREANSGRVADTSKYGDSPSTDESGPGKGEEGRPDTPGEGYVGKTAPLVS